MPARPTTALTPAVRPYPPPRKTVLLLGCMDLRLLDDTVRFMNGDNLANRYDQFILAGAALGVMQTTLPSWRQAFFDHLDLAVELHAIKDVYILEHRNCGAYGCFLGEDGKYGESDAEQAREEQAHREQAFALRDAILAYATEKRAAGPDAPRLCPDPKLANPSPLDWDLKVTCFLMDLWGTVHHLANETPKRPRKARGGRT